jgi:hypothetical protein
MTILLRTTVKFQAAVEILSPSQSLILAHTVENQTGATFIGELSAATALNIRPPLAGKLQARLIKTAKLLLRSHSREKSNPPHADSLLGISSSRWFALSSCVRFDDGEGVGELNGANKAGVSVREISEGHG